MFADDLTTHHAVFLQHHAHREGRCTTSTFGIGDLHFPVDNRPFFEGNRPTAASNSVDFPVPLAPVRTTV